jgi:Xaa-Pro aminopeptidase
MILFDYDKATWLMKQERIDLLLPHTLINAGYLADHWKPDRLGSSGAYMMGDEGLPLDFFIGLPRDRQIEPFITCHTGGEEGDVYIEKVWVKDIRRWGQTSPARSEVAPIGPYITIYSDALDAVVAAIKDRNLEKATIGVEMPVLGVTSYNRLQHDLPDARFVDVTSLFEVLREIKSEEEIRRLRVAAQAAENARNETLSRITEETTDFQIEAWIGEGHFRHGARHEFIHTNLGPQGALIITPNGQRVQRSEIVRIDSGRSYRHYQSDISRVAVLGDPSDEILKAHQAARKAEEAVLEKTRARTPICDLYHAGNNVFMEAGYSNFLGSVGHGLGRSVHEMPFLTPENDNLLQVGMVMAVELVLMIRGLGCVAVEDMVVVERDGYEALTTTSGDLYPIPEG